MEKLIFLTLVVVLVVSNCFAIDLIQKRKLIIEDIDKLLDEIQKQEMSDEDRNKLQYYKEYLEKDKPVPEDYKGIQRAKIKSEDI